MSKSKGIATRNPSDVLDTTAKLFRVLEGESVEWNHYRLPIDSRAARRNLAEYLKLGCPRVVKEDDTTVAAPTGYDLARTILGQDFITPEEIASARGLTYTGEQLAAFADTFPSEEVIRWCQANNFMLIVGPPNPLSLLEIRDLKPEYFYSKTGGWYAEEKQRFSRDQKVRPAWLALRKEPVSGSTSKTWEEQIALLSGVEYVPNDAEVEWALTTYKAVRDVYLLSNIYVRTSSLDSDGCHVRVGRFDGCGFRVHDWWNDGNRIRHYIGVIDGNAPGARVDDWWGDPRRDSLGLASGRKF